MTILAILFNGLSQVWAPVIALKYWLLIGWPQFELSNRLRHLQRVHTFKIIISLEHPLFEMLRSKIAYNRSQGYIYTK